MKRDRLWIYVLVLSVFLPALVTNTALVSAQQVPGERIWGEDQDAYGKEDHIFVDKDGDGIPQKAYVDMNEDGTAEKFWVDRNDDGKWDGVVYNLDPEDDRYESGYRDDDLDGMAERLWIDSNNNGRVDNGEVHDTIPAAELVGPHVTESEQEQAQGCYGDPAGCVIPPPSTDGVCGFLWPPDCGYTIPTLTEWGMIAFCAVLCGWMAWVIVRRRNRATVGG